MLWDSAMLLLAQFLASAVYLVYCISLLIFSRFTAEVSRRWRDTPGAPPYADCFTLFLRCPFRLLTLPLFFRGCVGAGNGLLRLSPLTDWCCLRRGPRGGSHTSLSV